MIAKQELPVPPKPREATPSVPSVVSAPPVQAPETDVTVGVLQKPCSAACFPTQYYHPGHYAIDMQERGGGPIFAAEAGTVIRADYGWNGGYGNVVEIDHGNDLITVYGHNKELGVKVGDTVSRGQKIADMGNTGLVYGKTGIHVHFEVRLKGVKKNPLLYIQE
jgi:murein DD-endopeptidase MepM/ murein hydrolase activator NlpD